MKLFLLRCKMSSYTSPDILLGCFTNRRKALYARRKYISQHLLEKKVDPWEIQGYWTVNLKDDVEIIQDLPTVDVDLTTKEVFVVSMYSEGFGQIVRRFFAVCGSEDAARVKSNECQKGFSDLWPEYLVVKKIVLDQLLSGADEDKYWGH